MKPRTPKHFAVPPMEVPNPGQYNSGLITILSNDPPPAPPPLRKRKPTVKVGRIEDMWVGSKRYRVPEHVVVLDFWRKIRDPNAPYVNSYHRNTLLMRSSEWSECQILAHLWMLMTDRMEGHPRL